VLTCRCRFSLNLIAFVKIVNFLAPNFVAVAIFVHTIVLFCTHKRYRIAMEMEYTDERAHPYRLQKNSIPWTFHNLLVSTVNRQRVTLATIIIGRRDAVIVCGRTC